MARYTGPSTRISRRFGHLIIGSGKALERRNYPPGQHGPKSRRKNSEYSVGLNEKQKLRYSSSSASSAACLRSPSASAA
jgi:small subunit ribosomal protein S4